jgi:hypothetical protein
MNAPKPGWILALTLAAVLVAAGSASAQQWQTVTSKEVGLRVDLPPKWTTKTGTRQERPFLEATNGDATMFLYLYSLRDEDLTLEDLLDDVLDELGVELDDDAQDEDLNGLDALVGETTATFNGREVGMFVVVAGRDDMRYVAYVMTKAALFDDNTDVMNRIVDSLAPLTKRRQ